MRAESSLKPYTDPSQSHMLKKSILWNVVEPGDPYDIRKSMIARLPGDSNTFMGNKLQLVCLLQAAQIQRLAMNLQQYRVRFNEVQKSSLDRHSYQVQIKELADKLQQSEVLRSENIKLKKFSQRLNQELEQTKLKYSSGNTQLNTNYQQALLQIQNLTEQNHQLTTDISNFKQIITTATSENQTLKTQMQRALEQKDEDAMKIEEYQHKFTLLGDEISRLNSVLKSKAEENYLLSEEHTQIKTYLNSKKEENQELRSAQLKLNDEVSSLSSQLQREKEERKHYEEESRYILECKDKLDRAGKEVERLSQILARNQKEKEELRVSVKESENKISYYSNTLNEKNSLIEELEEEMGRAQNNSSLLGPQIERLNSVLKAKLNDISALQSKLTRATEENQFYSTQISALQKENREGKKLRDHNEELQFQISNQQAQRSKLTKTNGDLLRKMNELSLQRQKNAGYEQKLSKQSEELSKITENLHFFQRENKTLQNKIKQYENMELQFKKNSKQITELKRLRYQQDVSKKNLQERTAELEKQYNSYKGITSDLSNEVQRLNQVLRVKLVEWNQLTKQNQELKVEKSSLKEAVANSNAQQEKIEQYENRFALLSLQIERLNSNIKIKVKEKHEADREVDNLRRQVGGLREEVNQYRGKMGKAKSAEQSYQMKLITCQGEIERLNEVIKVKLIEGNQLKQDNRDLRGRLEEASNKDKELGDLQRLNSLLRLKVQEAAKWQASNSELIKKVDYFEGNFQNSLSDNRELTAELHRIGSEKVELLSQLKEYKIKVDRVSQQFDRLHNLLNTMKTQNAELKRQVFQLKKQSNSGLTLKEKNEKLIKEIERLKGIVQIQEAEVKELRVLLSQDYALDRRLKEQLSLIVVLFAEIQTLRRRIEDKEKEIEVVRRESIVALKD